MDIASRLDEAMKDKGFSQAGLSRASGVPQPTINRILQGVGTKGPEASTLKKLAWPCDVTFEWLHEGRLPKSRFESGQLNQERPEYRIIAVDDGDRNFAHIPKVRLRLSAGVTGFHPDPDPDSTGTLVVNRSWIERHGFIVERLVAIRVKGESMEPSLYEDDLVVVNTADVAMVDGNVYAVNYEGEAVVKRLSRDAGEWWLTSDNPDQRKFHRKLCRSGECIIVGRIVRKESDRI